MPRTPGPWNRNIKPASRYPTVFAGRNTHVAMVVARGLPEEEIEANCNLIAAAPDLLAALEAVFSKPYIDEATARKSEAAIKKARGE